MGFLKGLIGLPIGIVADTLTLGGQVDGHGKSYTLECLEHMVGDDQESRLDREIERAERIRKLSEKDS